MCASKDLERPLPPLTPPRFPPIPPKAWGQAIRTGVIDMCASKDLERSIPELVISMGGVRRIMGTPMPFAYISHLRSEGWGGEWGGG